MELEDLEQGLRAVAGGGHVLNCQELLGLQAGLSSLKSRERYKEIFLWGKVLGEVSDYYVAFTLTGADLESPFKRFFYAGEDFEFRLLPALSQEAAEHILELALDKPLTGKGSAVLVPAALTELHRLAQLVQEIDFDTAAVPKGAHSLNEAQVVVPNSFFKGLSSMESTKLGCYVHYRPPCSAQGLRAAARTDAEFYANFLDCLQEDLPRGCWSLRQDPATTVVTLRSLTWPGYVSYHVPGTTKFGGLYFGYAAKSADLPFLI